MSSAESYLGWAIHQHHGPGKPAVVFDIDDTLVSAGYAKPGAGHLFLKPATPPSYLHRANAPACTTIEYKSGTRAHIASEGYSITADFGDQYSDLLGGNAGRSRPRSATTGRYSSR